MIQSQGARSSFPSYHSFFLPTVWAIVTKYFILDVVSGGVLRPRHDASAVWAETHGIVGLRSNLTGLNPG